MDSHITFDFSDSHDVQNAHTQDAQDAQDVYYPDVYCPDVVLQRKAPKHTLRQRHYVVRNETDYFVNTSRPYCADGVPVTEVDEYFTDNSIYLPPYYQSSKSNTVPLGKKDNYDQFVFVIEELCSSKTVTFDKKSNMIKTSYKVPIMGHMENVSKYSKFGFPYNSTYSQDFKDFKDLPQKNYGEKFIMVRGKMYSLYKCYRENGLEYAELHIPENYFSDQVVDDDEHVYVPHKTLCAKDSITFSFHHDVKISTLMLKPEKMSFKLVRGDNSHSRYDRQNSSLMLKQKYSIKVLENEPGFVSKFELYYRSELTGGIWVKHGVYNGNVGITDVAKISFDEIQVKEIRLIPLSFHKSFEKIRTSFIGKTDLKPLSDEIFVTYELCTPRDGKYLKYSSKLPDKFNYTDKDFKYFKHESKEREKRDMFRNCANDY